jgi:hypothetical protein
VRARRGAVKRKPPLTSLMEQGLELVLRRPMKAAIRQLIVLPECRAGGGKLPGVDLNNSASLLDRTDDRE